MRAPPLIAACALAALFAAPARAQQESHAPSGLVLGASMAAGGEMGLAAGQKAGLLELELLAGWEHAPTRLSAELAAAIGFGADPSLALRPGVRYGLADLPLSVRAALDLSNARTDHGGLHARWLLFGAAWELRFTSAFALTLGLDSGVPLAGSAGVPFLVRFGGTFRP